ncbi:MAG: gliding motility-associated C-terminal domain-containing protein [Bacteroidales bacterium]|nr:gliding motility-associated C-terminal domain-containing protein [Bacteroidales bacterium]
MSRLKCFLFVAFLISLSQLSAQRNIRQCCSGVISFIENKNQWDTPIKYKVELTGIGIFLEEDGITYVFEDRNAVQKLMQYKLASSEEKEHMSLPSSLVNYHAFKVNFVNAHKVVSTSAYNPAPDYINYYIGDDKNKWASEVRKFGKVEYQNLYDYIDVVFYGTDHLFKYDFVVKPQGNPENIIMAYEGVDDISLNGRGNLLVKTSVGDITELKPYAYQIINGDTIDVACKFLLSRNQVTFQLPDNYNRSYNLIIDPTLIFSTFSGSTSDNWGYTATYDYDGFVYAAGIAMGVGYPFTLGSFQQTFGGAYCDISITKYDTTGSTLKYSTLLGGNGPEIPHSIFVNNNNELFVFGTTGSNNFPVTTGAYDETFNGGPPYVMTNVLNYNLGSDIVVTRFNATGTALIASTYLGGTGNDGLSSAAPLRYNYADEARGEVFLDENNNCWIASSSQSLDFPVTANSFQQTHGGGQQDGVIINLDNDLSTLIWSSYIGGSGNDAVYSITIDENDGHIYVSGGTSSQNFPVTPNALKPNFGGGSCDGFISKIHKNGNNIIHSTYYGSNAYDQAYFVERDKLGYVYVFGQTQATGNTFIHNALWATPNGGQFISKLGSQLDTLIWSTAFGTGTGVPNISPTAFLVDLCNNIYLSGWGGAVNGFGGTSGLPITANAFQSTTNNNDFYLLVITDDASSLVYATYFGGNISADHVDGGTSRFDKKGVIYQSMCAGCGGHSDTPTTPGAWSQTNNSSNCNNAVFKMDFGLPVTVANFNVPPILCAPATINFFNTSSTSSGSGITASWNFGDGTTSNLFHPTHTYTQSGVYNVQLIVTDTGSCNFSDTIVKQVVILSNTVDTLPAVTICQGDFAQIGILPLPDPNTTYSWVPAANLSSTTVPNPIASPLTTTNYLLLISNGICTDSLYQRAEVDNLNVYAGPDTTVCQGTVTLTAITNQVGNSFLWSTNSGFTDTINNYPSGNSITVNVNGNITYYVQAHNANCTDYDSVNVTVSSVSISATPTYNLCAGGSVQLSVNNLNPSNPVNYSWTPISSIISGANTQTPLVNPQVNTTYTVTATDNFGCHATAQVAVHVIQLQLSSNLTHATCFNYCDGEISISPYGGGYPYTFSWSNSASTAQISNLCAGPYSVTVTDTNNCQIIEQYNIVQPPVLSVLLIDTVHVVCNGICDGLITVGGSGGTPPYSYSWISGQNTPTINGLCAGIYTVTVTDSNNCFAVLPVEIDDTSNFDAQVNISNISCFGFCDGEAQAFGIGGTMPYTYQWVGGQTTDTLGGLCDGVYNVTVTESLGCLRNVYITVTQPPQLIVNTNILSNPSCYGFCDGEAQASISGGTQPYNTLWSNNQTGISVSNLCDGTYSVIVTDSNLCIAGDTFIMQEPTPLILELSSTNVPCVDVCNGVAIATVSGSTPPYTFLWSDGQTTSSASNLCSGNYSVTVLDDHNCSIINNITVADSSVLPPTFNVTSEFDTIYNSQSSQLIATQLPGFSYSWSPSGSLNNPNIFNPIASPTQTTTYYLTLTDPWGCTYIDTITIIVIEVICDDSNIFIPNAFSPNGDGYNDLLLVRGHVIDELYFTVYNRWGEKLFESKKLSDGWDGVYNGMMSESGVYVYYLEVICIDKQEFFKKGNITLVR